MRRSRSSAAEPSAASRAAPASPTRGTSASSSGSAGSRVRRSAYASAAAATSASVTGPGATCRRSGPSGKGAISRAGSVSGSSLGVGAWTTCPVGSGLGRPSESSGTAHVTVQARRSRSSTGRSATSSAGSSPDRWATCQTVVRLPSVISTVGAESSWVRVRDRPSTTTSTSVRPGRARSSSPGSASRAAATVARAPARSGSTTSVANPSGGVPSAGQGSRSTGTAPSRRASSAAGPGTASTSARVRAALNRTPPVVDTTAGSSLTARTAAKPTPNRPTLPVSSRLADARSVASPCTPAASSGAPVLAARSTPPPASSPASSSRSRPGTPARSGGVGGVLRQLDEEAVAVAAADQVLLGVGVLAEPGRGVGPGGEHPAPDRGGVEGIARRAGGRPLHARASRRGSGPARRAPSALRRGATLEAAVHPRCRPIG